MNELGFVWQRRIGASFTPGNVPEVVLCFPKRLFSSEKALIAEVFSFSQLEEQIARMETGVLGSTLSPIVLRVGGSKLLLFLLNSPLFCGRSFFSSRHKFVFVVVFCLVFGSTLALRMNGSVRKKSNNCCLSNRTVRRIWVRDQNKKGWQKIIFVLYSGYYGWQWLLE